LPTYIDLGQGILNTIYDVYAEINNNENNIAISELDFKTRTINS